MIVVHPAVLEEFRARREMRIALAASVHLLPAVERLQTAYLDAYGTAGADRLFAEWEAACKAERTSTALREWLATRCEAADATFDALPLAVRWAWLDAAIPV